MISPRSIALQGLNTSVALLIAVQGFAPISSPQLDEGYIYGTRRIVKREKDIVKNIGLIANIKISAKFNARRIYITHGAFSLETTGFIHGNFVANDEDDLIAFQLLI